MVIEKKEYILEYDDSTQAKEEAFAMLLGFFIEHEAFHGEVLIQCDDPQIYGPVLLAEIADRCFKFKDHWRK